MSPQIAPIWRKIAYAISFEGIGLVLTALVLARLSHAELPQTLSLSIVLAVLALAYNLAFNTAFEAWETHQPTRGRPLTRRIIHAVLFEGGLMALTVPIIAKTLDLPLGAALLYDITLTLAFMVYTCAFTWAFDRLFGLPLSAR